jgi:hypothetical protein
VVADLKKTRDPLASTPRITQGYLEWPQFSGSHPFPVCGTVLIVSFLIPSVWELVILALLALVLFGEDAPLIGRWVRRALGGPAWLTHSAAGWRRWRRWVLAGVIAWLAALAYWIGR